MRYCCNGGRPLTGVDNSDKMREECIGHTLTSIGHGSWGSKNFHHFSFDNGYVVEIPDRTNHDEIYDNRTFMEFELFLLKRRDGYDYYFICEENANQFYQIQQAKQKILNKSYKNSSSFNIPPKRVKLKMTCYQLRLLTIKDQNYCNAHDISWVDYVKLVRANPKKSCFELYDDDDD